MSASDDRYADKVNEMDDYEAFAEMDRIANKIHLFACWNGLAPHDYEIIAPITLAAARYEEARIARRKERAAREAERATVNAKIVEANERQESEVSR